MHIKTNKNITYKINLKTTINDTRFKDHHLILYNGKKYRLLLILFINYLILSAGGANLEYNYKDILLYKRLDSRFPICAIYLYQYMKKYYSKFDDVKLFIITNHLVFIEVALYYKLKKIGIYPYMDLYNDKNKLIFENKYENIINRLDDLNKIYENNNIIIHKISDSEIISSDINSSDINSSDINSSDINSSDTNSSDINKYNVSIVYLFNKDKINDEPILNIEYDFFYSIIKGLEYLEIGGDLIISLPTNLTDILKQIIFLLLTKFQSIKYNNKDYFYSIGITSSLLIFRNYTLSDISDLKKILNKWTESKSKSDSETLISLVDIDFDKEFNKFCEIIDKKIYRKKLFKKLLKLCEKKNIDINNIQTKQIKEIENKKFLRSLPYNIYLAESANLKVKNIYKTSINDYHNKIIQYNLKDPQTISYNLTNYGIKINNKVNFLGLKEELNLIKFYIDTRNKKKWGEITLNINISRFLTSYIKNKLKINVTRAYIKLYEILYKFNLVDTTIDLKSLHICEMPGNFIAATNHYFRQYNKTNEFEWYGNSLNPYNKSNKEKYGSLFDDAYGFLERHPDNWLWGPPDTGDITDTVVIKYFENKFEKSKVNFFTSDCGLACNDQNEMLDQEKKMSLLSICQFFICILTLRNGSNAVFKIFLPVAEENSISYIKFLSDYFKELNFVKQASGSAGSSEIYIIAKNKIKDINSFDKKMIYYHILNYDGLGLGLNINVDDAFKAKLYNITEKLVYDQIEYLYRSFYYYDNAEKYWEHQKDLKTIKYKYAEKWIEMVNFKQIDTKYDL